MKRELFEERVEAAARTAMGEQHVGDVVRLRIERLRLTAHPMRR
jgi:hypothetical protein